MAEFKESNICPICGGKLIADNVVLTSYPPQYRAACEKCGKVFYSHHVIGFVDIPKVSDGMWCSDDHDYKTCELHVDTGNDVYALQLDEEGHYVHVTSKETK